MRQPLQLTHVDISYDDVLVRLGYAKGKTQIDAATNDMITAAITLAHKLLAPRSILASAPPVFIGETTLSLEPGLRIVSGDIVRLIKPCVVAWGFAVTIGPHLEEKKAALLAEHETTQALILDAVGSVAAEQLAEDTHHAIEQMSQTQGLKVTRRFSPGYGDWPVSAHRDFLTWLGAERIGISLTSHSQMLPEKSVSALLGAHLPVSK